MSLIYVKDANGAIFKVDAKTHRPLENPWVPKSTIPGARYMDYAMWAGRRGGASNYRSPIMETARRGQRVSSLFGRLGLADGNRQGAA